LLRLALSSFSYFQAEMITFDSNELLRRAKEILANNWTGAFTKPAPHLYPHQWNWDAGFIALGYSHFDLERACQELRFLFSGQWSNGMLPQIIFQPAAAQGRYFPGADFWQTNSNSDAPQDPVTSGITMPPVHGFVLWEIWQNSGADPELLPFFKALFPKVKALHEYLYQYRDPAKEGLVYIRHPWESGTDNSPTWDHTLGRIQFDKLHLPAYERQDLQHKKAASQRPNDDDYDRYIYLVDLFRKNKYDEAAMDAACPFKIQDPLFNGILCYSNECMAKLAEAIDEDPEDFNGWHAFTRSAMNEKLWNRVTARYDSYDLYNLEVMPTFSANAFIPLLGEVPDPQQAQRMVATLMGPHLNERDDIWLCPSYSLDRPDVDFQKYWRGPVWININWMLGKGLQRYGFIEEAAQLQRQSLHLIEKFGFYEYYDPRMKQSENGYGTDSFSWTAALCIDIITKTLS